MLLDSQQIFVEEKLKQLAKSLEEQASEGFFKKVFWSKSQENQLKSFYIHGDVGRGKSMLMKKFFDSLKKTTKTYFHFNSFMRLIHENLRDIRKEKTAFKDQLIEATKRVVKTNRVVCFDEFQVLDIADAMLLSKIFSYLFSQKIVTIFTSNSEPLNLYKNGLQREVFLEFVEKILLKNCQILHLNSPTDYRSKYLHSLTKRYFISDEKGEKELEKIIAAATDNALLVSTKIKVWGREIEISKTYKNVAVFNFDDLCRVNFAASEFQAICQKFDLIFLLKVPQLLPEDANEARRFIIFIDEIYEQKTGLIILAKTNPEKIYENGIGVEAFKRTISRLNEIKSDQYWLGCK
jgi:cell division protein ZapE